MEVKTQNTVAIVIGLFAATAIGAALIPVVKILLTNSITYSFPHRTRINYFAIYGYGFLWMLICACVGGYTTSWIAVERKVYHAFLTGIAGCLILLLAGMYTNGNNLPAILNALAFIPLTLIGGMVRKIIENKREDQNL
jgi:hypothetical protein